MKKKKKKKKKYTHLLFFTVECIIPLARNDMRYPILYYALTLMRYVNFN